MSQTSILITQCLQHDFIAPIADGDPLPNFLHIGHEESKRLLGVSSNGPIAQLISWAHHQDTEALHCVHIRDWHNKNDPNQKPHLDQFGEHCIAKTKGAEFIFDINDSKSHTIINSTTLNDFNDTELDASLSKHQHKNMRIGITGVWTEAKVIFLAYELATRYPNFEIAVCSALTASSSRSQHFYALEQLQRIVGVQVIDSLGEFIEYLGGSIESTATQSLSTNLAILGAEDIDLKPEDEQLLRYLFRDCKTIKLKLLDGGFSGNLVAGIQSIDMHGQEQAPHVVKIGPRTEMARERTAFEKIESVLGNNAPAIADYSDLSNRGAIKYRYASMGSGSTTTFQSSYIKGTDQEAISTYLSDVYETQLGRFYRAAVNDKQDLFEYYCFDSSWADSIKNKIEILIDECPIEGELTLPGDQPCPNLFYFYKHNLDKLPRLVGDFPFSFVHGDLNGANIIIDERDNVWLIDFFHTHRGHVLKDFVKLENDLLYIYTSINTEDELKLAYQFTDFILSFKSPFDFGKTLPSVFSGTQFEKCFKTLTTIRAIAKQYIPDESPQLLLQWLIPQMRYSVHTIGFDEPNRLQRVWALYTSSRIAEKISNGIS